MNRATIALLICGLSLSLGAIGNGCIVPGFGTDSRPPPVIIPDSPPADTLSRTMSVVLRGYPETDRITWDFGDGATANNLPVAAGQTVVHQYAHAGVFNVTVYLFAPPSRTDANQASIIGTGMLPIGVVGPNTLPIAVISIQDVSDGSSQSSPLSKRFSSSSSKDPDGTIVLAEWDFGDGTTAQDREVEHTYERSGRYLVRLTVTDDRGGTASTTRSVLLNSGPVAAFTVATDPANPLRATFDASTSTDADGVIAQFLWDFGDSTPQGNGQVVTHVYDHAEHFTVTLTVVDDLGSSATASQTVDAVGTQPLVRSISPTFGVVNTIVSDAIISGENLADGTTVSLRSGGAAVPGTNVHFVDATTIRADFDLNQSIVGGYNLIVRVPNFSPITLHDAFRVVSENQVRLTTSMGDVLFELVPDAPITTANFLQYVTDKFYDGTIFHRVVAGFVVQGGGLLPDGTPKPGVRAPIQNEFSPTRSNLRGTVAMAKLGNDPNSATCQFFVNLGDNSQNLDNQNGGFTVFAHVVEGMDVVDAISAVPVDSDDRPVTDVLLTTARRE